MLKWKRIVSGEHVEVALQILQDIRLTDLLPVQIPAIVDVKNVVPIFGCVWSHYLHMIF
ncbi:MAG: hypothetical protein R3A45_02530 [Bdellovibrionota bacterium]